jgi:hypothetical protein
VETVVKSLDELRKDQKKAEGLEQIRKRADEALNETARLRAEIESLRGDAKAQEKYNKSIETLRSPDSSAIRGNKWRGNHLTSTGFSLKDTVTARNPEEAIAIMLKKLGHGKDEQGASTSIMG